MADWIMVHQQQVNTGLELHITNDSTVSLHPGPPAPMGLELRLRVLDPTRSDAKCFDLYESNSRAGTYIVDRTRCPVVVPEDCWLQLQVNSDSLPSVDWPPEELDITLSEAYPGGTAREYTRCVSVHSLSERLSGPVAEVTDESDDADDEHTRQSDAREVYAPFFRTDDPDPRPVSDPELDALLERE